MKLVKDPNQPRVTVQYPPRTELDKQLLQARTDPHCVGKFDTACNMQFRHVDGANYLEGEACPHCGVEHVTDRGHGPLRRVSGRYGADVSPSHNQCTLCGANDFLDQMFLRHHGASAKKVAAYRIPALQTHDHFVVKCEGQGKAVNVTFMDAIRSIDAASYDPATSFSTVTIHAASLEDAVAALEHDDFDDDWFAQVPVDSKRRPLVRWCEGRLHATDENALRAAQAELRRQRLAEAEADVEQFRRERMAAI